MTKDSPKSYRKYSIAIGGVAGLLASAWLVLGQIDDARSRENLEAFRNMSRMLSGGPDNLLIEFADVTEGIQARHASRIEVAALVKLTEGRVLLCEKARGFVHRSMHAGDIYHVERLGKTITERKYLPKPAAKICDFALKVVTNPQDHVVDGTS